MGEGEEEGREEGRTEGGPFSFPDPAASVSLATPPPGAHSPLECALSRHRSPPLSAAGAQIECTFCCKLQIPGGQTAEQRS